MDTADLGTADPLRRMREAALLGDVEEDAQKVGIDAACRTHINQYP